MRKLQLDFLGNRSPFQRSTMTKIRHNKGRHDKFWLAVTKVHYEKLWFIVTKVLP